MGDPETAFKLALGFGTEVASVVVATQRQFGSA
jgi:hypothetical protein